MKIKRIPSVAASAAIFLTTASQMFGASSTPQIISFAGDSDGTFTNLFPGANIDLSLFIPLNGFTKFDPSLGTLNEVQLSIEVDATVSVAIESDSIIDDQSFFDLFLEDTDSLFQVSAAYRPGGGSAATALTFDIGGFGSVGDLSLDPADFSFPDFFYSDDVDDRFGDQFLQGIPSEGTLLTSDPDYIASDFEGFGTVVADALGIEFIAELDAGSFSFQIDNLDDAFIEFEVALSGGDATLIYDYTPVPEPASLPIIFGAIVTVCAVGRRRR
ncbi:MAG: PEP-CTERM sorting domain-containing protein [Verrucomicrobia bacterium]|jgi:hypothetical protein|nr:PEP-CTERM sorting domain-containing protein [Verrucomicrobiota bacterium]